MHIIITREKARCTPLIAHFTRLGIAASALPLIQCALHREAAQQLQAITLTPDDTLVFLSANGVRAFLQCAPPPSLGQGMTLLTQGQATARALVEGGHHTPQVFPGATSDAMAPWVLQQHNPQGHIYLVQATNGRTVLHEALHKADAPVTRLLLYTTSLRTPSADEKAHLTACAPLLPLFFSPSAVHGWKAAQLPPPTQAAAFGEVTARALAQHQLPVSLVGDGKSMERFVAQVSAWVQDL